MARDDRRSESIAVGSESFVPVRGQGDSWVWVEPDRAYLGEGWLDDPNIDLLTTAFGDRPNSQLVPWDRFERKAS